MSQVLEKQTVLGYPVHLAKDYLAWIRDRIYQGQGGHIVTLNAEMSMQAESNAKLADIIKAADLVIPDGAGVVLYLRWKGKQVQRYPGIDLAEALLQQQYRAFLFGGQPGVADIAAKNLQTRFPQIQIAGCQHGYLGGKDMDRFCQTLLQQQPQLVLVGLGVPRQEFWIAQYRHLLPEAIWIGVGGSFDIWAGVKERAPAWLRDNHLEWAYRLYREPWRWKRMLALPKFAVKTVWRG